MTRVGLVAIGRNEGERLQRCLQSVQGRFARIVYVDSGSTDGSQQVAQALGAEVVALDTSAPFTAARARNAGVAQLMQSMPELEYVQFIDGDCELDPAWPQQALQHMVSHERIAVVCGRRRERYPERSVYNHLCDIEWNGPVGRVASCGGDAMVRVRAFDQVGGYDPALIAGEEPDMCYRMAEKGWEIWQLRC